MKKLFLLMAMVVLSFGMTSCESQKSSMKVEFYITSNVPTDADITKIEDIITSKGLPIGVTTITIDKAVTDEAALAAIEAKVKQILADFLEKVKAAEINALNTGATVVLYTGKYPGSSSAIAVAKLDLK